MELTVVCTAVVGYALFPSRRALTMGAVALVSLVHPMAAIVVVGAGFAIHRLIGIRQSRSAHTGSNGDGLLAVELVGLGVTAGLPFRNAAAITSAQVSEPVAREMSRALRSVSAGQPPSIEIPEIRSMFSAAQASESSGTPLAGTLNAVARDSRRASAAASKERLAKLPVKMLFPLAFLILPGFVLLTVVPPLMSGLSKLG
jgi:Flp pilus assembly protein TadB